MKEPWFWRDETIAARVAATALAPAAVIYDASQTIRAAIARPTAVDAPVICIGNATVGGAGKTPFALALFDLLKDHGVNAHFATRGFGGALTGPVRVELQHAARDVGDEALLLAARGPTFVAKSRLQGVKAAAVGADVVIMDDGHQNPTVKKRVSLLLVDAADPAGDARVFPAGPLREPLPRAIGRADAIVAVGDAAVNFATDDKPLYRVHRMIETSAATGKFIAFCGIGRPNQFFAALEAKGFSLVRRISFPNHHPYRAADLRGLRAEADRTGAALMTTEKDFVRLGENERAGIDVAKLKLIFDEPRRIGDFVLSAIGRP